MWIDYFVCFDSFQLKAVSHLGRFCWLFSSNICLCSRAKMQKQVIFDLRSNCHLAIAPNPFNLILKRELFVQIYANEIIHEKFNIIWGGRFHNTRFPFLVQVFHRVAYIFALKSILSCVPCRRIEKAILNARPDFLRNISTNVGY